MTIPFMWTEAQLDVLWAAGALCEVCEQRVWTQRARWCDARVCAACAENEPEPDSHR
jgi:hypothetical protein